MRLLPYISRGKVDGVILTLIDISQIKRTEQQLSELSEIVDVSHDAIFRLSSDGIIRTWNAGAARLFMLPAGDVIGTDVGILSSQESWKEDISQIPTDFERRIRRRIWSHSRRLVEMEKNWMLMRQSLLSLGPTNNSSVPRSSFEMLPPSAKLNNKFAMR